MIMVTGATGTIGLPLVNLLASKGIKVRAVAHRSSTVGLPSGVELIEAELSRPDSIAPYLEGVTALFLHPRAVGMAAEALLALAREKGVRRVVAQAAINVDDPTSEQPSRYQGDRNKEVEQAAVRSGLEWVSLRPSSFAANSIQAWGPQIRAGDIVRYPYAAFAEAPIDERDIAEVAVHALLADDLLGQKLELTGPQSLTHAAMVAIIGAAIGRQLHFQEISPEMAKQGLIANGAPEAFANVLMARYAREVGRPAQVTNTVEKILGRPARTFAQWAADHAGAFQSQPERARP